MVTTVIGTPWRKMHCIGLVNALYSCIPNLDGSIWGRVLPLPKTRSPRPGDLIIWWGSELWLRDPWANDRRPSGVIPCHAAILLVPEERLMLHSGISDGDYSRGWEDRAKVEVAEYEPFRDGFHNLFRSVVYRPR